MSWQLLPRATALAIASGAIGTAAIVSYLLATSRQLLTITPVLASLYPAIPVMLALTVLRERLSARQLTGLIAAAATACLVAA